MTSGYQPTTNRPDIPPKGPPKPPSGDPGVNHEKKQFMIQYILNARLSGRAVDDSATCRGRIVDSASDLYDQVVKICRT